MSNKQFISHLVAFIVLTAFSAHAQEQRVADSLALVYQRLALTDTAKLKILPDLSFNEVRDLEKGLSYANELISLSSKTNNKLYLRSGYFLAGTKKRMMGNLSDALADYFKSAELAIESKNIIAEAQSYGGIGDTYSVGENDANATKYYNKAIDLLRKANSPISLASYLANTGDFFFKTKNYDSALLYSEEAKAIFTKENYPSGVAYSLGNIGMVYASIGKDMLAEKNINEAITILEKAQDYYPICTFLTSMADIYLKKGNKNVALEYASRSLKLAESHGLIEQVSEASKKLSEIFEKQGDSSEAYAYYKKHIAFRDSIHNIDSVRKMADLRTNYEVGEKQSQVNILTQQKKNQRQLAINLAIILGLLVMILAILMRNNKAKQKAFKKLELQKQKTEEQKAKAEDALNELQVTQKQLIQSAKMVSLGELTAGIAHEIQNPLNFVNNFSELSVELLDELKAGTVNNLSSADKADADEIITILADNLKKISDHGKRADAIVKGMLQHSRANTDKKEPTDINALAAEYLRLSYHGLRAKDKEFKSQYSFSLDPNAGLIEAVPQDIGRVLLNLCNNAFYSVNKRKKPGNESFEPLVIVSTKRINNKVEIRIKDNGMGIPQKILDKVFQPFFTTKPTGQGTGLGLSLSYDIIHAHGGELKVETKEGEYAEFILVLPVGNIDAE